MLVWHVFFVLATMKAPRVSEVPFSKKSKQSTNAFSFIFSASGRDRCGLCYKILFFPAEETEMGRSERNNVQLSGNEHS